MNDDDVVAGLLEYLAEWLCDSRPSYDRFQGTVFNRKNNAIGNSKAARGGLLRDEQKFEGLVEGNPPIRR